MNEEEQRKRRRARLNAVLLGLVALAFYIGYMIASTMRN